MTYKTAQSLTPNVSKTRVVATALAVGNSLQVGYLRVALSGICPILMKILRLTLVTPAFAPARPRSGVLLRIHRGSDQGVRGARKS